MLGLMGQRALAMMACGTRRRAYALGARLRRAQLRRWLPRRPAASGPAAAGARRSCAAVRQACGAVHRRRYDTYFAAHEVPGQIDCPLQVPVDDTLQGIDYVQAWLDQLLSEARYAASFTFESSVAVLERACPDYRGLHVSLCDLLQAHEDELARRPAQMAQNGQ